MTPSPHIPRSKSAIWTPRFTPLQHLRTFRTLRQIVRRTYTLQKSQIIDRQDICSSQRKNKYHLSRPPTNPLYHSETLNNLFITQHWQFLQYKLPVLYMLDEAENITRFLGRETEWTQCVGIVACKCFGRHDPTGQGR